MPTPSKGYWRDGVQLPGVTTILKQKDSTGLIAGANKVGRSGKHVYGKDGEWTKSADIGTAVHALIQSSVECGQKNELPPIAATLETLPAYESFIHWSTGRKLIGKCEQSLVHPTLPFGGTIDYLEPELIYDWKTNSSLDYVDELYAQVGAYAILADAHGYHIKVCTVVRFPKEGGKAEELVIPVDSPKGIAGKNLFMSLMEAYHFRQQIQKKDPQPLETGLIAK